MAAKQPFWEIIPTIMKRSEGREIKSHGIEYFAHFKGKNGKIIGSTEVMKTVASIRKAIAVFDPMGVFEVRNLATPEKVAELKARIPSKK